MRNRANPTNAPPPASEASTSTAEPEPMKRTKYDELVDVLADGLFEMIDRGEWGALQRREADARVHAPGRTATRGATRARTSS